MAPVPDVGIKVKAENTSFLVFFIERDFTRSAFFFQLFFGLLSLIHNT